MQKLKVLITGNALDSVRLVEVVVTVPVEVLMPALIETMQLPLADLFGKEITYVLRFAKDGRAIAPNSTLAEAGVTLGARLVLDAYVNDGTAVSPLSMQRPFEQYAPDAELVAPDAEQYASGVEQDMPGAGQYMPGAEQFAPSAEQYSPYIEPLPPSGNGNMYASATMADMTPFADEQYSLDMQMRNTSGLYGPGRGTRLTRPRRRGSSRRAFLVTAGVIGIVGGVGLGYAAYHTYINEELKNLQPKQSPATTQNNVAPKVASKAQNQNKPNMPQLPTSAKLRFTFAKHKDNVRLVSWSPDGTLLASCADDKHAFVWQANGTVLLDILHPGGVRALAWSPDGKRLVTGANNQVTFFNAQTGAILASSARQHTQIVTSIAWISHNQMQVVSGGEDKQVIVWDTKTYRAMTVYKQHKANIDMVSCSVNGQTVASSADDGIVRIWNAADGQDMHGYYRDVTRPLRGMAFAPDGTQLAVGGDDGIVRIWNALTCKNNGQRCMDEPQRLQVTQTPVRTVAWSPDGRLLAIGGNDGMFSVWSSTQTQKALFSIKADNIVRSLSWSPDGKQLACATGNNVSIWDLI